MLVKPELSGQQFYALSVGPNDPFNESASLMVECATQEGVDTLGSPRAVQKLPAVGSRTAAGSLDRIRRGGFSN
jgi:predicted 3-demethylubiquinone-9 3-methyltransferase (glyoxalase superfamily)